MQKLVLTIPTLYGDHHTTAVRKILEAIDGISDVYVSSAYNQVSASYDPKIVAREAIEGALAEQGYDPHGPELAYAVTVGEQTARHTAAHEGVGDALSFAQAAPAWEGRPLWPCPGFEYTPTLQEEE